MAETFCCVCELKFTELCRQYSCQGCRRHFCVACIRASGGGSVVVIAASNLEKNDWLDKEIKACKFCIKTSKRHIENVYPSESPRVSPEPSSPLASGDKTYSSENGAVMEDGCICRAVENQDLKSCHRMNSSRFSSVAHPPQNSLFQFPLLSDEEHEESGRHMFSSSGHGINYSSDLDLTIASYRLECYCCRSAGSSPLDSPSRFSINTPRGGHSVQTGSDESPKNQNGCPFSPEKMAISRKLHRGTGDFENGDGHSDQLSVILKQSDMCVKPLDLESNSHIWLPPPPEDEDDEAERNFFEYDDDDDDVAGNSGGVFSSSSSLSDLFSTKEKQHVVQKEPLKATIQTHFRALVSQLLLVEGIDVTVNGSPDWLDIVSSLAWQAANFVKPDTRKGGSMDPGSYVKIKCVASGNPRESSLIKGIVCTKNIRHKRMTSQYKNPRLLLLGGSLEYPRAQHQLASINTLLEEEMNHLKMIVSMIEAHRTNVLLVENSVSSYAQEYLLAKEISLVLNVKRPLLERIARCTGALITPSADKISVARLGQCELFRLEKVSEEHEIANRFNKQPSKTLMYFEGCPRRLGCTVLLKGLCREELKKLKHVVQLSVFAAYHLSLETSFLADEGAHLPNVAEKSSYCHQDNNTTDSATCALPFSDVVSESLEPKDSFDPEIHLEEVVREAASDILNCSSAFGTNDSTDTILSQNCQDVSECSAAAESSAAVAGSIALGTDFVSGDINPAQIDLIEAMHPEEGQLKEMDSIEENEVSGDYLPTADNQQSILVSFSSRCVSKGTLCERSRLLRIRFYGSSDKPLGRYLRNDLFDQGSLCRSCKEPVEAHVHCYTHNQGVLTINVRRLDTPKLPGERDGKMWMWHRCLKCEQIDNVPPATRRVVMSDAAWGLSFGKFLELSFSDNVTANRLANCGHSLQRDCLRFYGFGSVVAFFHYSPIDVLTVHLPPPVLAFHGHHKQEWVHREVEEILSQTETLYAEVSNVLQGMEQRSTSLSTKSVDSSDLHDHILELKDLLYREREEYYDFLNQAIDDSFKVVDTNIDILELNRMRRSLLIGSRAWDRRLYSLDSRLNSKSFTLGTKDDAAPRAELKAADYDSMKDPKICDDQVENGSEYTETHLSGGSISDYSHLREEYLYTDRETTINVKSAESLQSPASNLSDKIDSAWTGTDMDASQCVLAGQGDPVDKLPLKRLMAPVRVYSFDSAIRLQEKIHRKMLPLSHLAAARSFHVSGDYKSMVRDPDVSVMRTYSQLSPHETQFTSSFLSSVSRMTEGPQLLLPQTGQNNLVIAVYDDEPTSVIAYALSSKVYEEWVSDKWNQRDVSCSWKDISREDSMSAAFLSWQSFGSSEFDFIGYGSYGSEDTPSSDIWRSPHLRIPFGDDASTSGGKAKFLVTCYFAKQFDLLREKCCPSQVDFVRSLSRCRRWNAQGGKSNVYFAKSMDERFIIKQVTKTELESFQEFAAEYFKYLNESLDSGSPTCLAKVLGIFQVTVKHPKGGRETKLDLMVMENLFYQRSITKIYDLKGSVRSRYNPDKTGANKVLLDMNLLETLRTSPIFLGSKAKRRLERAVWNDTSFLASVDVMDYSLLVGLDEERNELVLGIIDFMRQYTWDKHLETWVKASGILGGGKNTLPTIISPKQYKRRFRKAMTTYFLTVPEQLSN